MRTSLVLNVSKIPAEGQQIAGGVLPADLHLEEEKDFGLEPGARVDLQVEKGDDESAHVRGTVSARLRLACARCLEEFVVSAPEAIDLYYLPHRPGDTDEAEDEVELSDRDMVVAYYAGDRLDVGEAIREHLVLDLPMKRLCREACAGLCARCGKNLNDGRCGCPEAGEELDPRLAGLKTLLGGGS